MSDVSGPEEKVCAREECGKTFVPKVHNQRFCHRDCCRIFTNARILAQYHQKKNRVMTGRVCKTKKCDTVLSRYNENEYCASCENKNHIKKLRGWGWEIDDAQW